ncbi:AAA family ATPase [Rhodospirillaceae bacterium KN72]|uniref:AAA family ATPase n=1 Tax=Pacificispira spongiicola TaxID=2729598 RepID=A0A7Y0DYD5_9PROT|nr:AAA family ATPase [Pacificispira spongiicola]NMM43872.1 AAA family ATPase [Pacificispira spongiicola]
MIRINTIHIEEFRGIRDLTLDLGGKNFGICGPNGTGKSGVVDAIEFCLTGNLTRLSGQGQGELSVKGHAPHVDYRDDPDKAKVTIVGTVPSLKKDITIARSVKNPRAASIKPADPELQTIIQELQSHPEFALSRREIAKYIITPPAQRSTDVQNLLRLDQIGDLRKSLLSYANKCKRDADEAERARALAETELKTTLNVSDLDREKVLQKANAQRSVLDLPTLTELTPQTSFKEGAQGQGKGGKKPGVSKDVALADLAALLIAVQSGEPGAVKQTKENALASLKKLKEDEQALSLAMAHGFITTGLNFVTEDACPLCDKPWDAEELREHLKAKLLSAEETDTLLKELSDALNEITARVEARITGIRKAANCAAMLDPAVSRLELDAYANALDKTKAAFEAFEIDPSQIENVITALEGNWWEVPAKAQTRLDETHKGVKSLPDSSAKDKAIDFLAVLQDRYERVLGTSRTAKILAAKKSTAQKIYNHYSTVSNKVLEDIYDAVAKEFTEFYKVINDDEGSFVGELKAEPAKLGFNVDFYGRGTFPPGAYHSEGHQDGMGLCLYLALMKHTLNDKFTFAVLDDVLMSVDTGHRREVCRLLKTKFPNTQFVLTTHDRVWLQYMKTESLIQKGQYFGGWKVETGPRIWDDSDIWTEIQNSLDENDVPRAAALLRRYLEYISAILADNLRAQVEYRGDASYDLGDLLPPTLNRWKDRLKKGTQSAKYWGHAEVEAALLKKLNEAATLIQKTNAEQWAINKSVHFNTWENFTDKEFKEVSDAFKALLDHIRCKNPKCSGYPYLTPRKGPPEVLRCNCGTTNINLKTQ